MAKKKAKRVARSIVVGHLEKISSGIFDQHRKLIAFDQHRKLIAEMMEGHYGVYALYRREKLYYVGLGTDLRKRINQHLKDRHKGKWTHFSLYILRKADHLREIEALVLRIADPTGNYVKGKLRRSRNLLPELKARLAKDFKEWMEETLGGKKTGVKKGKKKKKVKNGKKRRVKGERPLKGFFPGGKMLYRKYKGKVHKAWVIGNGRIKYNGQWYESPSAAGSAVRGGKVTNGWRFWKYKDESGELVYISEKRK